jgi:hypothetical protein
VDDPTRTAFLLDSESPPLDNSCSAARTGSNPKRCGLRWSHVPGAVSFVVVFETVQ